MKLIIAGGRDYAITDADIAALDNIRARVSEVVSGGARGADQAGEAWALSRGIPIRRFLPDWSKGRGAGHARNKDMALYAEAVFLLPGGEGTASMRSSAHCYGLEVFDRAKGSHTPGTKPQSPPPAPKISVGIARADV